MCSRPPIFWIILRPIGHNLQNLPSKIDFDQRQSQYCLSLRFSPRRWIKTKCLVKACVHVWSGAAISSVWTQDQLPACNWQIPVSGLSECGAYKALPPPCGGLFVANWSHRNIVTLACDDHRNIDTLYRVIHNIVAAHLTNNCHNWLTRAAIGDTGDKTISRPPDQVFGFWVDGKIFSWL